MRKELTEIMQIERYLLGGLSFDERASLDATRIIDPEFAGKIEKQQRVHQFVRLFARKQQKRKLEEIHSRLSKKASFIQQLKNIFH